MTDEVKTFIDKLSQNDMIGAGDAFKDALRTKMGDALDTKRQDIASGMFKAEPHSDPKPEISGTGTFTRDGQVEPTGNNAVQEPAQEVPNEVEPVDTGT